MRGVFIFSLITAILIMRVNVERAYDDSDECKDKKDQRICDDSNHMNLRAQTVSCLFKKTQRFSMHFLVDTKIRSIQNVNNTFLFKENVVELIKQLLHKVKKYGNTPDRLSAYTFYGTSQFKTIDDRTISNGTDIDSFESQLSTIDNFTIHEVPSPGNKLDYALRLVNEEFKKNVETQQTKILWVFSDARSDNREFTEYVTKINSSGNSLKNNFNTAIFTVSLGECPFGYFEFVEYQYAMRNLSTTPGGYSACYGNWLETLKNYLDTTSLSCPVFPPPPSPPPPPPPPVILIVCTIAGVLFLIILILAIVYKLKKFCKPKPLKLPIWNHLKMPDIDLNNDTPAAPCVNRNGISPNTTPVDHEDLTVWTGPGSSSNDSDQNSILWNSRLKEKKDELSLCHLAVSSIEEDFSAKTDEEFTLHKQEAIKVKELLDKSNQKKQSDFQLELCSYKFNCLERKPGFFKGRGFKVLTLYSMPVILVLSCDDKYVVAAMFKDTTDTSMTSRIENEMKKMLRNLNR